MNTTERTDMRGTRDYEGLRCAERCLQAGLHADRDTQRALVKAALRYVMRGKNTRAMPLPR